MNIGTIIQWASNTIPNGWLLCDGSAVSRTTYSQLFSVIGTNFGVGDGSTTFNLPDLRGRIGVGKDSNDTDFDTLGETGGSKELQQHRHQSVYGSSYGSGDLDEHTYEDVGFVANGTAIAGAAYYNTRYEGTGNSGNVQPYVVVNYIIKATTPDTIKISELNELTTLDSDDLIPVVDTSADETKKISASNLINNNINNMFIIEKVDLGNKTIAANDAVYVTMPSKTGYTPYCLQPLVSGDWADKYATYVPLTTDNTSYKVGIRNENQSTSYTWNIKIVILYVKNS